MKVYPSGHAIAAYFNADIYYVTVDGLNVSVNANATFQVEKEALIQILPSDSSWKIQIDNLIFGARIIVDPLFSDYPTVTVVVPGSKSVGRNFVEISKLVRDWSLDCVEIIMETMTTISLSMALF